MAPEATDGRHFENARISAYFSHLVSELGVEDGLQVAVVAHMVANSVHFLPAIDKMFGVGLLLPKPKSSSSPMAPAIRALGYPEHPLSREWAADPNKVASVFRQKMDPDKRILIVDIGGYFAPSISELNGLLDGQIIGLMEGTENGAQKYEQTKAEFDVPLVTVARSPLKLPEDYLVGAGIVFSVEAALRGQAEILQTRTACVIGYGRVGSGVAEVLRGRGISTVVHDNSPLAMAEAAARGFRVFRRLDDALRVSNLVVSATGSHVLNTATLDALRTGTVLATVTSADDEFEDGALERFRRIPISRAVSRHENDERKYFWLINEGNAANFLDGAVIGPAIQLIEGEKLAALQELARGEIPAGCFRADVSEQRRRLVAETWNEHFLED